MKIDHGLPLGKGGQGIDPVLYYFCITRLTRRASI